MDLADKLPGGSVTAHAILLGVSPAHAAPDVPLDVAPHPVGQSRRETFGKDLAVGYRAPADVHVKGADMRRAAMGDAAVDNVELPLVRRETDSVGLDEVV